MVTQFQKQTYMYGHCNDIGSNLKCALICPSLYKTTFMCLLHTIYNHIIHERLL